MSVTTEGKDYVVYACESCGRRIFTERGGLGGTGRCPLCAAEHVVGGRAAQPGGERRRSERVAPAGGKVKVGGLAGAAGAFPIHVLGDLSATGVGITLPAEPDPANPGKLLPPSVIKGDVLRLSLQLPELLRPRSFWAEVRRVVPDPGGATWTLGLQFVQMDEDLQAELRALVRRLGGRS